MVGSLAIIGGLVLVLVELRQSQAIAEAQIVSDMAGKISDVSMAVVGEDLKHTLAKACERPEEIDRSDIDALNAYYGARFQNIAARRSVFLSTGLLENDQWRGFARNIGTGMLGTAYGRYWWISQRDFWISDSFPEISEIIEQARMDGLKMWGDGCWWEGELPAYLETLH